MCRHKASRIDGDCGIGAQVPEGSGAPEWGTVRCKRGRGQLNSIVRRRECYVHRMPIQLDRPEQLPGGRRDRIGRIAAARETGHHPTPEASPESPPEYLGESLAEPVGAYDLVDPGPITVHRKGIHESSDSPPRRAE